MANISLPRDNNRIAVIGGTSSIDGVTPVTIYVDPITHRVKVDASSSTSITVGTSTVSGGTTTRVLYDNAGVVGEYPITGTGNVVMSTSPTLVTPILGVANATSLGVSGIITTGANGATNGSVTFSGSTSGSTVLQANVAAGGTVTLPASTGTLALTSQLTSGTVTAVSVATANGFSGTVANATTTPAITIVAGAITPTSVNGNVFTTGSSTYTGTAGQTYTFPTTTATIARTDAAQTFTGTQTASQVNLTANAIAASGNAATVPITSGRNIVTNNSAATLTITMTTASAVNMQTCMVQILDSSAVAQTITWVNTENSSQSVPTTSNGSTTLPLTVGFIYNSNTSKWRCIASA